MLFNHPYIYEAQFPDLAYVILDRVKDLFQHRWIQIAVVDAKFFEVEGLHTQHHFR